MTLNINYTTTTPRARDKLLEAEINNLSQGGGASSNFPLYQITAGTPAQPTAWTENGVAVSATYNPDGTIATITKNGVTRTITYLNGYVSSIT